MSYADRYLSGAAVYFSVPEENIEAVEQLFTDDPDPSDLHDGTEWAIAGTDLSGLEVKLDELGATDFRLSGRIGDSGIFLGDNATKASEEFDHIAALSNIEMEEPERFPDLVGDVSMEGFSFLEASRYTHAFYLPAEYGHVDNETSAVRYILEEAETDYEEEIEDISEWLEEKLDELDWKLVGSFLLMR